MESDGAKVTDLKVFLGAAFCLSGSDPPPSIPSFSQDLTGRISSPPFSCLFCDTLSKVAEQSDVFLLLPWLYFMPSCLFSLFFLSQSHPLVFSFDKKANREIETSVVRQIIACIWTFHLRVYTLYPKPACFMHCVGREMHFEISCLIWVFLKWKCKVFIWPIRSVSSCCLHLFSCCAASRLWFSTFFHASTFSHLRGSLGATDDRLPSRCKLTFGFHNQMAGGQETSLKTPSFS